MRHYIDIIRHYLEESILAELDRVNPDTGSKEIGSGGAAITANMTDMLPHNSVWERNQPQAYSEIFARNAKGHNTSHEREEAPSYGQIKRRRNNAGGVETLSKVPAKGNADALLHSDFAGGAKQTNMILPSKRR